MSQPSVRGKMNGAIKSKLALWCSLVAVLVLLAGSRSFAQDTACHGGATEVMQTLEPDQLQVTQPAGLAYMPAADTFVLLDASAAGDSRPRRRTRCTTRPPTKQSRSPVARPSTWAPT